MQVVGVVIDVVLVALVVVFALVGFKKGFFKSVLSLFSWIVCLLIAIFCAKYVAMLLDKMFKLSTVLGNKIALSFNGVEGFGNQISSFENKEQIIDLIKNSNINGILKTLITGVISKSNVDMASSKTVASLIGASLGHICVVVISGVLIFILLKIILAILNAVLSKLTKNKVLGGVNKAFGLVFGALKGFLIIVIINIVLVVISLVPLANNVIKTGVVNNTHVERVIYNKTDELFGKYVIKGGMLQNFITNLWESRN